MNVFPSPVISLYSLCFPNWKTLLICLFKEFFFRYSSAVDSTLKPESINPIPAARAGKNRSIILSFEVKCS
jgi:hypothetical protein